MIFESWLIVVNVRHYIILNSLFYKPRRALHPHQSLNTFYDKIYMWPQLCHVELEPPSLPTCTLQTKPALEVAGVTSWRKHIIQQSSLNQRARSSNSLSSNAWTLYSTASNSWISIKSSCCKLRTRCNRMCLRCKKNNQTEGQVIWLRNTFMSVYAFCYTKAKKHENS